MSVAVIGLAAGIFSVGAAGQEAVAGAFTAEQAAAGWANYARSCSECHGTDLRGSSHGPELTGSGFLNNWGARTTTELVDYIRADMPPGLSSRSFQPPAIASMPNANSTRWPRGNRRSDRRGTT